MKHRPFALLFILTSCLANAPTAQGPVWTVADIQDLRHWIAAAPQDALPALATTDLDHAMAGNDPAGANKAATTLALRLARMHLNGVASPAERRGWHIVDTDQTDLEMRLARALDGGPPRSTERLDRFFGGLRPQYPDYELLRGALATERNPALRQTIALNMERWRWMPLSPGPDYLLVNAAAFEVGLWRKGQLVGTWPVIVGKTRTPTPVFSTLVRSVTFNPWWEVPANIVRESIGSLVRRHPALARQRGYVWGDGRYRQKPGPANSLGQMKLAMPNPYNVYLHDTPDKKLFTRNVRAFSHGCIRVGNALGFAASLLQGVKSADEAAAIVSSGQTVTVPLAAPLPVYITYFTATANRDGTVRLLPDMYGRDAKTSNADGSACAA